MDVRTVVVSTLLSVALSVLAASRVAARQEQGKARQLAQRQVAKVVRSRWQEVRRNRLGLSSSCRQPGTDHLTDLVFGSQVLDAARALPWWRRRLVRRRVGRLIGRRWVDLVELEAPMHDSDSGAMNLWLLSQVRSPHESRSRRDGPALMTLGLLEGASPRALTKLERELRRLQDCW